MHVTVFQQLTVSLSKCGHVTIAEMLSQVIQMVSFQFAAHAVTCAGCVVTVTFLVSCLIIHILTYIHVLWCQFSQVTTYKCCLCFLVSTSPNKVCPQTLVEGHPIFVIPSIKNSGHGPSCHLLQITNHHFVCCMQGQY